MTKEEFNTKTQIEHEFKAIGLDPKKLIDYIKIYLCEALEMPFED